MTKTRIMVFGTFDMVHPGHRNLFRQARALAPDPFLIVSVAQDLNVKKIKGFKPRNSEKVRMNLLKKTRGVNKVVLGGQKNYLDHIVAERPDIIALGYDQTYYVKGLASDLKKAGLKTKLIRLKPYKPHIYKTSLLKKS